MVEAGRAVKTYRPATFREAVEIRAEYHTVLLAGGTDLMVKHRKPAGVLPSFTRSVEFIGHLDELKYTEKGIEVLRIGAGVNLSEILKNPDMPEGLKAAASQIAAPGIRNMATIGGNICNASPAGDMLPILYCLDASLLLAGKNGFRKVLLSDFITGPGKNSLRGDELVKEIYFPLKYYDKTYYRKVGTRMANSLSKLSFTGLVKWNGKIISDIRIALGAVAPVVVRSREIEKEIIGRSCEEISEITEKILLSYKKLLHPINDQRASAVYREQTALKILKEFLEHRIQL